MKKKSKPLLSGSLKRIVETEAHHRLVIALGFAAASFGVAFPYIRPSVSIIVAWDVFALSSLALAWLGMFFTDAQTRIKEAHLQDSSYRAICCCLILASIAGLAGAGMLLGSAKSLTGIETTIHVVLAGVTVASSWFLVHTMMSLHYTHIFYCCCDEAGSGQGIGVNFPNEKHPDFLDFAYFSFVIGMTCQVSDVQITSRRIRRIALFHGLLSFAFNTIILAFSINLAATLL